MRLVSRSWTWLTTRVDRVPWVVSAWLSAASYLALSSLVSAASAGGHDASFTLPAGLVIAGRWLIIPLPSLLALAAVRSLLTRRRRSGSP